MPGELLNEQLQILFPICDEKGEIYIKNEYGRSIITYSSSGTIALQIEFSYYSCYGKA